MDMEHEIKKDAPSAQQAAGSIDTLSDHKCGACNGSGWMVRDEDIGTDQECFSCDGSGRVEDDAPISAAAERGVDYIMAAVQSFADEWRRERGNFGIRVEALNTKARIRRMLEEDAAKLAATPAQPIADMSAPTDEPTAWALLAECDPQVTNDREIADYWVRKGRNVTTLYARAAAPVSGPTEDTLTKLHNRVKEMQEAAYTFGEYSKEAVSAALDGVLDEIAAISAAPVSGLTCKACNGAGTWIGQHDGYDDADCAVCDGSGKAAPVSGQGTSIGDDAEFHSCVDDIYTADGARQRREATKKLAAYIDSRPRSEDSRVKVLEEAAVIAEKMQFGFPASPTERAFNIGIESAVKRIRALASTTPQKADDEN